MTQSLMILPQEARNEFELEANKFRQTQEIVSAQRSILMDLTNFIPETEDLYKEIDDINAKIAETDIQILEMTDALAGVFNVQKEDQTLYEGEKLLKAILHAFSEAVYTISTNALDNGQHSVLITEIMQLETELNNKIESLSKCGIYLESEADAAKRIQNLQQHTMKVLSFIKQISPQNNEAQ